MTWPTLLAPLSGVKLVFTDDTEIGLGSMVALVNTAGGPDALADLEA